MNGYFYQLQTNFCREVCVDRMIFPRAAKSICRQYLKLRRARLKACVQLKLYSTPSRRESTMSISPHEDELAHALIDLKSRDPQLGISKIHTLLLNNYPDWIVSEKRTRKILQLHGLIVAPTPPGGYEPPVYPTSRIIESLNIQQWSQKVQVRYFNKKKGKGLVASTDIDEGETIWREDPFIIAAEPYVFLYPC